MRSAVPHPAILGVIHECGGRLRMPDRRWEDARVEFLAAFKARPGGRRGRWEGVRPLPRAAPARAPRQAFEEAGAGDSAIACLRYHLLCNMLAESRINPFDRCAGLRRPQGVG